MIPAFMSLCAIVPVFAAHSISDIPNVHVADRTRYVANPDGVLSDAAESRLNAMLSEIWDKTSSEVVVVAVNDIDSDDIDRFATELFTEWGIGKKDKDNGLLLLIARDKRKAVFRTGYGMEGVLPDVICGRILRDKMFPEYKKGNYDKGTLAAVDEIRRITTTPGATEELMSKYANDSRQNRKDEGTDLFSAYMWFAALLSAIIFIVVIAEIAKTRKLDPQIRYAKLDRLKTPVLFTVFLGLGLPIIAFLPLVISMKRIRNKPHICGNCGTKMKKLDEASDNEYLTPAQDAEERLNSIDYDVWLCPKCNETDIIPYVNRSSSYTDCPRCGARACTLTGNRTVVHPTNSHDGRGVKTYVCRNCGNRNDVVYNIPKVAVPPVIILPPGGGGRGFGGGGFSGGSFGGGMTGGGGASGGW